MIPLILVVVALCIVGAAVIVLLIRRRPDRSDTPVAPAPAVIAGSLGVHLGAVAGRRPDSAYWDELRDLLVGADAGVAIAEGVVDQVRAAGPRDPDSVVTELRTALLSCFTGEERAVRAEGSPAVIVVVGVNGSGKTTTIAKLAHTFVAKGASVLVAAADTYRAAAADQIEAWGGRVGFETVRGSDGADPASVAFDGLSAAQARGVDVLIVDTAGRMHSNQNLMDELAKVVRVLERGAGRLDEVLLVIDGSGGQNSLAQARAFSESVGVTAVAVSKLDGSARGGMVLAIERELGLPVKLIGIGERAADVLHFDPEVFVDELLRQA